MVEPKRVLTVGAAQLGPIALSETRAQVVNRLLYMMARAHERRCDLVVFPELALTSFFPRWHFDKAKDIDHFFEKSMPGPETRLLFDRAAELGIGFCLGFAEMVDDADGAKRFNTSILVDKTGVEIGL